MIYYAMEPPDNTLLPAAKKGEKAEVILASDLSRYRGIDYDARNELISERLKQIIQRYMPNCVSKPVVYLDTGKNEQAIYWRFKPPVYEDIKADFRSDGIVSEIIFLNSNAPSMFTVISPKGVRSIAVRVAVAESILRRGILGLTFTEVAT
jgi:hypothetical protein